MKILVTGANGYIGTRLVTKLTELGHEVIAFVRNVERSSFPGEKYQGDLTDPETLKNLPKDIDAAYYLVHAMTDDPRTFALRDRISAKNFNEAIKQTNCKQIIYLGGLSGKEKLSPHLESRLEVESILKKSGIPLTSLHASIIIGAGSASFEIIRDLVEKLPLMIAPKWVNQKCQPIAIADVLDYLAFVLGNEQCLDKTFEIAGPEVLSYKQMLLKFAKHRNLKRVVITVPVFTPRLSSYWLIFITNTNYYLARTLIDSVKNRSVKTDDSIDKIFPKECFTFDEAVERAMQKIQQNEVVSSWRDAWTASNLPSKYSSFIEVPKYGCVSHTTTYPFTGDPDKVMEQVFTLGGAKGYYMNWAWQLRGAIDQIAGGVGLKRGKTAKKKPKAGDALDFWRVLLVDEKERRFLLYAEMKVPGEAWLELSVTPEEDHWVLNQIATFRPKGVFGRLYWIILYPPHVLIFKGLGKKLIEQAGGKLL